MCGIRILLLFMCLHGTTMQAFSLPMSEHQQLCADRLQEKVSGDLLNAWRVINQLWRLPLEEFTDTWTALIAVYLDHYHEIINEHAAPQFVEQCRKIHQFFEGLLCDPITQILAYHPCGLEVVPAQEILLPISSYFQEIGLLAYRLFYVLYFDALSYVFVHSVYAVSANIENYYVCNGANEQDLLCSELTMVHKHLIGTTYERRYARQLVRYQELLNLLYARWNKYIEQKESDA
jgi:hypothetical protein